MVINVRLGPEEERALRVLRKAKVNVSELVRRAIRDADLAVEGATVSASSLMKEIIEEFPAPARTGSKKPALDDRQAVRAYVTNRLRRR